MPRTQRRASLVLASLLVAAVLVRTEGEPSEQAERGKDVLKESELNMFGVPALPYPGVLTPKQCNDFIEEAERGDWDKTPDSIDQNRMYQIDIWNKGEVIHEKLYALLAPHVDRIKSWMQARFPQNENSMDWVFMRKYAKACERQGLKAHVDINEHSLNVALNTDFEDGHLFFIRQDSDIGKLGLEGELPATDPSVDYANVPRGGEGNNTRYFYPFLRPGHGIAHDKTLWHGITKVTRGVKYSLLFFFDEPGRDLSSQVSVHINNARKSHRAIDIFWRAENGELAEVHSGLGGGEGLLQMSFEGHVFVAMDASSGDAIGTYSVDAEAGGEYLISVTDLQDEEEEEQGEEGDGEGDEEKGGEGGEGGVALAQNDPSAVSNMGLKEKGSEEIYEEAGEGADIPEKIELWGYDVRPFLEDEEGRPRLAVIGGLAAMSLVISMLIILVFLPRLEEHERLQAARERDNEMVVDATEAKQANTQQQQPSQLVVAANDQLPSLEKPRAAKKND